MFGLLSRKLGMTQIFDEKGELTPVTALLVEDNFVAGIKTEKKDGYASCLLAAFETKANRINKPTLGQFPKGVNPCKRLLEVRDFSKPCEIGQSFNLEEFKDVAYVDVVARSKGKGYQGVIKRHGFGGGRATHGSKFHRANGSTGQAAYPARVFKGTKMAGRMGNRQTTVQNLEVIKIDFERKVMMVKGAVPGARNCEVFVRTAVKG